jgi:hypothetical protein
MEQLAHQYAMTLKDYSLENSWDDQTCMSVQICKNHVVHSKYKAENPAKLRQTLDEHAAPCTYKKKASYTLFWPRVFILRECSQ